jgi:23S rRNA (uracil1939-C5)-methyltransferase
VAKGSFRLRVSPGGLRGVWLDFANEDVKRLFEEKAFLQELCTIVDFVEIGQRRKTLVFRDGKPHLLKEPIFNLWTRTWIQGQPFELYSHIADFSQVGDVANQALIETLLHLLPKEGSRLFEFGAGNGNLTFPALGRFKEVRAFESDGSATDGLKASYKSLPIVFPDLKNRLEIQTGDFRQDPAVLSGVDTVLVNPPRSGVGRFLENLNTSETETLIYMSCFPESMAKDLAPLKDDWVCEEMVFVDQFPQTEHIEVLSRWKRR